MKTKLCVIASAALLLAGPALAQEPLEKGGTEPSTQMAPAPSQMAPEPMEKAGTAPSTTQPAPQASKAAEPLDVGTLRKSEDDGKTVGALNATVDRIEDMNIYDAHGKKIAEVDSVVEDKDGVVKGVAIEYGGFLGFGEKGAILTLDQIKTKDGNLVTEVTEDQLPNLPVWSH